MVLDEAHYIEKIGYSRGSLWAPFHAVGMVARFQSDLPVSPVQAALRKLQVLYPALGSRVRIEADGSGWLTTEGVGDFPFEVREKASADEWSAVFLEQERIPFGFDCGPLARFFLLRGERFSDLVMVAPHVICDGLAVTHVMEDFVALLNDPDREIMRPNPPPAVTWDVIDHKAGDALFLRGSVRMLNRLWPKERPQMVQGRYESLHNSYWAQRKNGLLAFELSTAQTSGLLARCKQHGVSATGTLVAALLLAQMDTCSNAKACFFDITVAVSIRNRMRTPPGRVLGVYASNVNLTLNPRRGIDFWVLAQITHARIHRALKDRNRILYPLALDELDPAISDILLAALSSGQLARKLGPLARFVKIGGMAPGLDVSNIGRVDFHTTDGFYSLDTILPLPPLWPGGGLALNVLTTNGRMNAILKYRLDQLDRMDVCRMRDQALSYLTGV